MRRESASSDRFSFSISFPPPDPSGTRCLENDACHRPDSRVSTLMTLHSPVTTHMTHVTCLIKVIPYVRSREKSNTPPRAVSRDRPWSRLTSRSRGRTALLSTSSSPRVGRTRRDRGAQDEATRHRGHGTEPACAARMRRSPQVARMPSPGSGSAVHVICSDPRTAPGSV